MCIEQLPIVEDDTGHVATESGPALLIYALSIEIRASSPNERIALAFPVLTGKERKRLDEEESRIRKELSNQVLKDKH